jgi:hypothetical protein
MPGCEVLVVSGDGVSGRRPGRKVGISVDRASGAVLEGRPEGLNRGMGSQSS